MALVMLPSDLPWWSTVNRKLDAIQKSKDVDGILELMLSIHDLCNVSLDPDDDKRDSTVCDGLRNFLENELKNDERTHFLETTIKNIAKRAQSLKSLRPPRGLSFSLQQQADSIELDRYFVAALLANAFFSTFPKRTEKTHPTLQDFNFSNFFRTLDSSNSQKAKLRCFLKYFDWLESQENFQDPIKISRKVMTGKQWLTIEDWTECNVPLCPLDIKHQGRIENSNEEYVHTVFTSARIGGNALYGGNSQECIQLFTVPETIVTLLYFEALEDNETIFVEGVHQIARIIDPKNKAILDVLAMPRKISLCFIDPENYCALPIDQYEEDNILRELNKCLLAFRQNTSCNISDNRNDKRISATKENNAGRLSPIGESGSNSPKDVTTTIIIKHPSTLSLRSSIDSNKMENDIDRRRSWLSPDPGGRLRTSNSGSSLVAGPTASGRRGRFIVLGSSGECLPVNRANLNRANSSMYSSCDSDADEFHSAKDSFDESDDEGYEKKFSKELDTPEKRQTFAQRLKEALRQSSNYTESTDSSYAVGISIAGSQNCDEVIRLRRGGSTGFVLTEDSLDEEFYMEALAQEKQWLEKFRNKQQGVTQIKKDLNDSSKYSFSTEYSSEMEEVYEQFSKWMEDPILKDDAKELDPRDEAVLRFANSLLKRTLSESFVGVPLTDGCVSTSVGSAAEEASIHEFKQKHNKPILNARSLSLELAKYKHRLAAQMNDDDELRPGNHYKNTLLVDDNSMEKSLEKTHRKNKQKSSICKYINWSVSCTQSLNDDDITVKISQLGRRHRSINSNLNPVASGNWGCGSTGMADVQLKLVVQWMAASVSGLPVLVYYTTGHEKLTKLDTVTRVLTDRKWTVGELASATLRHAKDNLDKADNHKKFESQCFFEKLIGI